MSWLTSLFRGSTSGTPAPQRTIYLVLGQDRSVPFRWPATLAELRGHLEPYRRYFPRADHDLKRLWFLDGMSLRGAQGRLWQRVTTQQEYEGLVPRFQQWQEAGIKVYFLLVTLGQPQASTLEVA